MSKYEFSLRQEVLMEVGASILGDLFRYSEENEIENDADPVNILYNLIRTAKQNIILSKPRRNWSKSKVSSALPAISFLALKWHRQRGSLNGRIDIG